MRFFGFKFALVSLLLLSQFGCERIPQWELSPSSVEESSTLYRLDQLQRWMWTCRLKPARFDKDRPKNLLGYSGLKFVEFFKENGLGSLDEVSEKIVMGSAFLWDADGHLVTHLSWAEAGKGIECRNTASPWLPAALIGSDRPLNLAVLKIDVEKSGQMFSAESQWVNRGIDGLALNERLTVLGSAFPGLLDQQQVSLQATRPFLNTGVDEDLLLFLPPAASVLTGGILVDHEYRVVGYLFMPEGQDWGAALSSERVSELVKSIVETGKVKRPYLGFRARFEKGKGFLVHQVDLGGPAHSAGLRVNDTIVKFEGKELTRLDDWREMETAEVGKSIPMVYRREGREVAIEFVVSSTE